MADDRPTLPIGQAPPRRRWVTVAMAVVIALLLLWIVWDHGRTEEEKDQARGVAASLAEQVAAACAEGGEAAEQLGDLCRQAEEVAEDPAEPVPVTATDQQLRPLVRQYVDEWLQANPPQPGRDGRTPTVDEITDLIMRTYEQNPPPPGEDGRTPTADEIRAIVRPIVAEEVAAYLLANPPPPGEPGQDGQPGQDGTDGRDGVEGEDGEPPFSWTTTRCDVLGQCVTERCERTEPFDPERPTYVCSEEPA